MKTKIFKAKHTAETVVELPADSTMEEIIKAHQLMLSQNVAAVATTRVHYTNAKMLADMRDCHNRGIGVPSGKVSVVPVNKAEDATTADLPAALVTRVDLSPIDPTPLTEELEVPVEKVAAAAEETVVETVEKTEEHAEEAEVEPIIDIDALYEQMTGSDATETEEPEDE